MFRNSVVIAVFGTAVALAPITFAAEAALTPLDGLMWLAGHWRGGSGGVVSEEAWLAPKGGVMVGVHRDARPGKRAFFEYLRIEARDDGAVYVASPMGRGTTEFPLVELDGTSAVFENPGHDFPQRIAYSRSGNTLTARAAGSVGGRLRTEEWVWELMP